MNDTIERRRLNRDLWQEVENLRDAVADNSKRIGEIEKGIDRMCFLLRVLSWLGSGLLAIIGTVAVVWRTWIVV